MTKGMFIKRPSGRFILWAAIVVFPALLAAQDTVPSGNIIGFIYAQDGKTPVSGAVVKFKNLAQGSIYESSPSDALGIFKVQGVETGVYSYGVVSGAGQVNADNVIGLKISGNETAKLSIAINPYGKETAAAVSEMTSDLETKGESLVGTVADFNPVTSLAQVQIVRGMLRLNDKIRTKGRSTDFVQEVNLLMVGSNPARRVMSGQTGVVKLAKEAQTGDLVYVVRNRKIFPFFLAPAGVAAVIAANTAVISNVLRIKDEGEPASAFKD